MSRIKQLDEGLGSREGIFLTLVDCVLNSSLMSLNGIFFGCVWMMFSKETSLSMTEPVFLISTTDNMSPELELDNSLMT